MRGISQTSPLSEKLHAINDSRKRKNQSSSGMCPLIGYPLPTKWSNPKTTCTRTLNGLNRLCACMSVCLSFCVF